MASRWDGRRRGAFLGYTFAVLPVLATQHNPRLALAGVLLVWPFVFDSVFTCPAPPPQRRKRLRRSSVPSLLRKRLVIAGYNHRTVTLLYIGLAATGAILAALWYSDGSASDLAVILVLPLLCIGLWRFVVGSDQAVRKQPTSN